MIANALNDKPLPVYGKGENVRDWLYVENLAGCRKPSLLTALRRLSNGILTIKNGGKLLFRENTRIIMKRCMVTDSNMLR